MTYQFVMTSLEFHAIVGYCIVDMAVCSVWFGSCKIRTVWYILLVVKSDILSMIVLNLHILIIISTVLNDSPVEMLMSVGSHVLLVTHESSWIMLVVLISWQLVWMRCWSIVNLMQVIIVVLVSEQLLIVCKIIVVDLSKH